MMKVEAVLPDRFQLGESGFWDIRSESWLGVDVRGNAVIRYNPSIPRVNRINLEKETHFAIPRSNGGGNVITQADSVNFLLEKTGKTTPFVSGEKLGLPANGLINDGKCDAKGRLWLGTFVPGGGLHEPEKWKPVGGIVRISADGAVSTQADQFVLPNGLDWTTDSRTMLVVDSFSLKIYAFDFDLDKGELSNRRVFKQWEAGSEEFPDGLCIDADNKAWVAMVGSGRVIQLDIETGEELQSINLPCKGVTCPNFGGEDFRDLYVTTSAALRLPNWPENPPEAGAIFKVTGLHAKGKAPNLFAG
ncbi:regucalcin [Aplysia californica]|uniref:Regucalcin n=1 Tax=Aplysia californica TaxID=6500 RepID=A0ABM1A626_APLCA|nr:regucalcin [Aplysia californica]